MTKPKWTPVKVRLGQIQAWGDNPRMSSKAQAQRIIASERKFGQPVPFLLMPEVDGVYPLLDGHQRLSAWLTVYGAEYVMDGMVSDRALSDDERREMVVTLHTGATGSWNWDALSGWAAGDLQAWGMDAETLKGWNNDANNLKELLNSEQAEPVDAEPQIDRAAELAEKWGCKSGDLWKLGNHKLLIGDCTVRENVERLMGGERADMVWIDPPYGVSYKSSNGNTIQNDELVGGDLQNFLSKSFNLFFQYSQVDAAWYIWHASKYQREFENALNENKISVLQQCIWVKGEGREGSSGVNAPAIGRADWRWLHEPCFYASAGNPFNLGDRTTTTVWTVTRDTTGRIHPTEKPIGVAEIPIKNSSTKNNIVLDGFCGSGTTIIAAHNLNRRCYAMEISEKYGAVILQRFFDATGITPELLL